jgi:hypothetical protein
MKWAGTGVPEHFGLFHLLVQEDQARPGSLLVMPRHPRDPTLQVTADWAGLLLLCENDLLARALFSSFMWK